MRLFIVFGYVGTCECTGLAVHSNVYCLSTKRGVHYGQGMPNPRKPLTTLLWRCRKTMCLHGRTTHQRGVAARSLSPRRRPWPSSRKWCAHSQYYHSQRLGVGIVSVDSAEESARKETWWSAGLDYAEKFNNKLVWNQFVNLSTWLYLALQFSSIQMQLPCKQCLSVLSFAGLQVTSTITTSVLSVVCAVVLTALSDCR